MADEKPKDEPQVGKRLGPEDLELARSGPAIYSNRVLVNLEAVVRITFVEQAPGGNSYFRAAVALPHVTAIELAGVLKRLLAEIEADLEVARAEHEKQQSAEVRLGVEKPHG